MDAEQLRQRFSTLTTAHIADGCLRAGAEVRCAPAAVQARRPGARLAGRVLPARHVGSVDIFLEALQTSSAGEVLVVDNGGRLDESCVGDLVALEAAQAGLGGILIWGLSRDSVDLRSIDIPLFSLGTIPTGPLSSQPRPDDALTTATIGPWTVTADDFVFGDEDGALFVAAGRVDDVLGFAESIRDTERRQAERIRGGESLREQVQFARYLDARVTDPTLTFRDHLRAVGGEIEV